MRLWEIRMNEERPYLQMWREVRVSFCKIAIVCFLSVRYRSNGLSCKVAGTPSSSTRFFIRVEILLPLPLCNLMEAQCSKTLENGKTFGYRYEQTVYW